MRYLIGILLLIPISCGKDSEKKQEKEFVQPEILTRGAGFDLTQLTFNENFEKLVSNSLDTLENDYTLVNYENAVYPNEEQIKSIAEDKRITHLEEKRYHFELLELDSIAQFYDLYANYMNIETDANLKIKTVWANARVDDSKQLDSVLHKLYKMYGKTVHMHEYHEKYGTETKLIDQQNEQDDYESKLTQVEKDIDYESFLYKYRSNSASNYYLQWNLEDRIIQIDISRGFESKSNFTTGTMNTDNFLSVGYLQMSKTEYNLIKKRLIAFSTKNDFPAGIKKPYYVRDLDFYVNNQKYINRNEDVHPVTEYNFKQ